MSVTCGIVSSELILSECSVGTNDSLYNFSYAKEWAGLDVVGYTANDFNITKQNWDATVQLIDGLNTVSSQTVILITCAEDHFQENEFVVSWIS